MRTRWHCSQKVQRMTPSKSNYQQALQILPSTRNNPENRNQLCSVFVIPAHSQDSLLSLIQRAINTRGDTHCNHLHSMDDTHRYMVEVIWEHNLTGDSSRILTPLVNPRGIYTGNWGQVTRLRRNGTIAAHKSFPGLSGNAIRSTAPTDPWFLVVGLHGPCRGVASRVARVGMAQQHLAPFRKRHHVCTLSALKIAFMQPTSATFPPLGDSGAIQDQRDLGHGKHEPRLAMH